MAETNLQTYLTSHLGIEAHEVASLLENCTIRKVQKNEFLLQEGNLCTHTFFVEKGLLRQFSTDPRGKEHIIAFAPENWFVTDRESAYFNLPSIYNIQALEESRVVLVDEEFAQTLSKKHSNFTAFNNLLLHNHIRQLQKRIHLLLAASAQKRYLDFVATYPGILSRVPQAMVASYLGVTPESLSRVRRELAKNHY